MANFYRPYERRRFNVFENTSTGEWVVVDGFKVRYHELVNDVVIWSKMVETYMSDHPQAIMVMVMLSYRDPDEWESGHIRKYMKAVKQAMGDSLLAWAWVAEIQAERREKMMEEGHPDPRPVHYHIVFVTDGEEIPMPDKSYWHWGHSNTQKAKSAYYIVKYVGKQRQKEYSVFPKHCRTKATNIRWSKSADEAFRMLKRKQDIPSVGDWRYRGASVTPGYAHRVIVPTDHQKSYDDDI